MRYRVAEVKARIERGEITDIKQVIDVGFCSTTTATSSFERYEGVDLAEFIENTNDSRAAMK